MVDILESAQQERGLLNYTDLLGVQFRYNGRSKEEGFDCYGLTQEIYRRIGIILPEYTSTDDKSLIHQMIIQGIEVFKKIEKPEPYCIVLFMIKPPYVSHVGVVLEDCYRFIHVNEKVSVVVERLDNILWERKVRGYYRYVR